MGSFQSQGSIESYPLLNYLNISPYSVKLIELVLSYQDYGKTFYIDYIYLSSMFNLTYDDLKNIITELVLNNYIEVVEVSRVYNTVMISVNKDVINRTLFPIDIEICLDESEEVIEFVKPIVVNSPRAITEVNVNENFFNQFCEPNVKLNLTHSEKWNNITNLANYNDEIKLYLKKLDYSTFLHTEYWKTVSKQRKLMDLGVCTICDTDINLHTHHKTYVNKGNDHNHMNTLTTLCGSCHRNEHIELAKLENKGWQYKQIPTQIIIEKKICNSQTRINEIISTWDWNKHPKIKQTLVAELTNLNINTVRKRWSTIKDKVKELNRDNKNK